MNHGDLKCIFLCDQDETQVHIFENCQPIKQKLDFISSMKLDCVFGTLDEQLEAVVIFEKINDMRTHMRKDIL